MSEKNYIHQNNNHRSKNTQPYDNEDSEDKDENSPTNELMKINDSISEIRSDYRSN